MKPNLGNAGKIVRTTAGTYGWLGPIYDALDAAFRVMTPSGASGIPNAVWYAKDVPRAQLGSATGSVGLYGFTGLPQLATGGIGSYAATSMSPSGVGASGLPATGVGASGLYVHLANAAFNGGSGAYFTINDLFAAMKNLGGLKQ